MTYQNLFEELSLPDARPVRASAEEVLVQRGFTVEQAKAVVAPVDGEAVVLAGAGAGKTKTLAERLVHLLTIGTPPESVLVCTFTRAAAEELKKRVRARLPGKKLPYVGTIHSLSLSFIGGNSGLTRRGVSILKDEELQQFVPEVMDFAPPEYTQMQPVDFLNVLQRHEEERSYPAQLAPSMQLWRELLEERRRWDFVILLKRVIEEPATHKFRHILVDEAQDLTQLQLDWLQHHSDAATALYLVGDDDQALYSFRGTASGLLARRIEQGAVVFKISRNFRSSRAIVEHSNNVISHNKQRVQMRLTANRSTEGAVFSESFNGTEEEVSAALTRLQGADSRIVLARTREVLRAFKEAGLPVATIHEAKGLEWDRVWVAGLENGVLPHALGHREEERRICYVAMTRARDELTLSYTEKRSLFGKSYAYSPSPFLREL